MEEKTPQSIPVLLPATHILQQSPFHCFPACLESFLRDNGETVGQAAIVERCPTVFDKGGSVEGAFHPDNVQVVAQAFALEITRISGPISLQTPDSIIIYVIKEGVAHWVRYMGTDAEFIYVMNPSSPRFPDWFSLEEFKTCPQICFLFHKTTGGLLT